MRAPGRSVHTVRQTPHLVDTATVPFRRAHSALSPVERIASIFQQACTLPTPPNWSEIQSSQPYGVAAGGDCACRGMPVE